MYKTMCTKQSLIMLWSLISNVTTLILSGWHFHSKIFKIFDICKPTHKMLSVNNHKFIISLSMKRAHNIWTKIWNMFNNLKLYIQIYCSIQIDYCYTEVKNKPGVFIRHNAISIIAMGPSLRWDKPRFISLT